MKKKKGYQIFLVWMLVLANMAAALSLAAGVAMGIRSGYSRERWEDILKGKSWLQSTQYEQMAADAVFDVLEAAAKTSRMELS